MGEIIGYSALNLLCGIACDLISPLRVLQAGPKFSSLEVRTSPVLSLATYSGQNYHFCAIAGLDHVLALRYLR